MKESISHEQLAAYVAGELEPAERTAVETAAAQDKELQQLLHEIQDTAELSREALKAEPALSFRPEQREAILAQAPQESRGESPQSIRLKKARRRFYLRDMVSLLAAATITVIVGGVVVLTFTSRAGHVSPFTYSLGESSRGSAAPAYPPPVTKATPAPAPPPANSVRADAISIGEVNKAITWQNRQRSNPEEMNKLMAQGYTRAASPAPPNPAWINNPNQNYWPGHNTESYSPVDENAFKDPTQEPLSTFSIDVDTASYSNVRRFLQQGSLPPPDAVRIEELVNYFPYAYAPPDGPDPFAARTETASCPWAPDHRLVRVALKGREIPQSERPPLNLTFLLDVSGSMGMPNKLPLVKQAMRLLIEQMTGRDTIAITYYASGSGVALPPTSGERKQEILNALDNLQAGGSTNGAGGITLAYDTARQSFKQGGVNRVILATDGDFNVGVTNEGDLVRLIEENRKSGVFLTVLGFGMGNLKDSMLEKLADKGNGSYAYIDTFAEARKVFLQQLAGTLITIAKDVKIQVEFNPARVKAYRLLGYEKRIMAAQDFNDDKKDAGEIGAGHTVTAFYEVVPQGQEFTGPSVDALKYQRKAVTPDANGTAEMLTLKLRYKQPDGETSQLLTFPVTDTGSKFEQASPDFRFATSVVAFGMVMRNSQYKGAATLDMARSLAEQNLGQDPGGFRAEFAQLVVTAQALRHENTGPRGE